MRDKLHNKCPLGQGEKTPLLFSMTDVAMRLVRNMVWKHYKGGYYRIVTTCVHTETSEPLVVYQCLYGELTTCARPRDMFLSPVEIEPEKWGPRFECIGLLE